MSRPFSDRVEGNALKILAAIIERKHPSIRELVQLIGGMSNNGVWGHLKRLRRMGLITWEPHKARTLIPADRVVNGVSPFVDRLITLGNAIVPQVAEWIGRRIIEASELPTIRDGEPT